MHTQSISDEGLVKSALTGDELAFSKLFERYRQPIFSAAYRIMRDPEDARDATQEIALKLYRSLHQWDVQKSKLSTWIYKMAVNHSIDCHRIRRRRKEYQLPEDDLDSGFDIPECPGRSPLNEIEAREQIEAVLRCAMALPYLQKRIFMDRYFDEHKLEEIAEREGVHIGTVKSSLHRATHSVRHYLQHLDAS